MRYGIVIRTLVGIAIFGIAASVHAQVRSWSLIAGPENEFGVFIPEGYLSGARGNYYLYAPNNENDKTLVDTEINVARYLNGILFRMDYWAGDINKIGSMVRASDANLVSVDNKRIVGNFSIETFTGKRKNRSIKVQYFASKKHLYRISTDTRNVEDRLVKAFFENARIAEKDHWLVPNLPEGTKSTTLPKLVEVEPIREPDSHIFDVSEVDSPPLLLSVQRVNFSSTNRHNVGTGNLDVRVTLSSAGTVTNAEIIRNDYMYMKAEAIEAAKKTIFIPAEKDGKLVAVSLILGKSFEYIR